MQKKKNFFKPLIFKGSTCLDSVLPKSPSEGGHLMSGNKSDLLHTKCLTFRILKFQHFYVLTWVQVFISPQPTNLQV